MSRNMTTILMLFLAAALSMMLFTIKQQMQDMEDEISDLNRSNLANEQAMHVLNAEWSHLNDPKRLRGLAARHLGLSPVKPEQFGLVADLSDRAGDGEDADQTTDFFFLISSALTDEEDKQ